MDKSGVCFYENQRPTKTLVKYAGRPFCAVAAGEEALGARLFIDKDGALSGGAKGEKGKEGVVFSFPEMEKGFYRFRIEGEHFSTETFRLLCVENRYQRVPPPKGAIYQIFPDRFRKGKNLPPRSDAMLCPFWHGEITQYPEHPGDDVLNNEFFGGDLYGVAEKLGYIRRLGCEWVYLTPIFTAYSNHKYDTGDFLSVDAMFGGRPALDELIQKCHALGMKLILDGVFNHVGRNSVYFDIEGRYGGAYHNPNSPYREWFVIRPDGSYDCWWGLTNLPKVVKVPSYRQFICETVIPEYMRAGIDGWRLDVVDEYDNAFLEEITAAVKKANPEGVVIGEVWDDVTDKIAYSQRKSYFYGAALDSATNYPLRNAIFTYFRTGDAGALKAALENQLRHYPHEKLLLMMNFLGTHDTERALSVFGDLISEGKSGSELASLWLSPPQREKAKKRLIAAYALLACLPGIPMIFYGDEAGLQGLRDPFNRRPFPWGKEDMEILESYRKINAIRAAHRAMIEGKTRILQWNDGFFVLERFCENAPAPPPPGEDAAGDAGIFCVCNLSERYIYHVNGRYRPLNLPGHDVGPGETGIYQTDMTKAEKSHA